MKVGAASTYREGAAHTVTEQLDAVHEELLARMNGMDINGKPLAIPGAPSRAQLDKLEKEQNAFARSLSEDTVTVEHRNRDGTSTEEQVQLGKTMADFHRKNELVNAKVAHMLKELDELDSEIAMVLSDFHEDTANIKADRALQTVLAGLEKEAGQAARQTLDDVKIARKEDRVDSDAANKKFQEFLKSL